MTFAFLLLLFIAGAMSRLPTPLFFRIDSQPQQFVMAVNQNCTNPLDPAKITMYRLSGVGSVVVGVLMALFFAHKNNMCVSLEESVSPLVEAPYHTSFWNRYFLNVDSGKHRWEARELAHTAPTKHEWMVHLKVWDGVSACSEACMFVQHNWRLLPGIAQTVQQRFDELKLPQRYVGCVIRRGDKHVLEAHAFGAAPVALELYILYLESVFKTHGFDPVVFVATDDCSVLHELRRMRPMWHFYFACDDSEAGFFLQNFAQFSAAQKSSHFLKFFVELYAMAVADVALITMTTNVAFLVQHLRLRDPMTTFVIDGEDNQRWC